jgi:hypothetical protein
VAHLPAWRIFPRGASGRPGPYRYTEIAAAFYLAYWKARAG